MDFLKQERQKDWYVGEIGIVTVCNHTDNQFFILTPYYHFVGAAEVLGAFIVIAIIRTMIIATFLIIITIIFHSSFIDKDNSFPSRIDILLIQDFVKSWLKCTITISIVYTLVVCLTMLSLVHLLLIER